MVAHILPVEVIFHDEVEEIVLVPLGPTTPGLIAEKVGSVLRVQCGQLEGIEDLHRFLLHLTAEVGRHPDSHRNREQLRAQRRAILARAGAGEVDDDVLDELASQVIS